MYQTLPRSTNYNSDISQIRRNEFFGKNGLVNAQLGHLD